MKKISVHTSNLLKECSKCSRKKPLDHFYFSNTAKGILHSQCKECMKKYETNSKSSSKVEVSVKVKN
jgi:hypothetical protein